MKRRSKIMNFDNGKAIRRYDLGHAWECNKCGNVLSTRWSAEECCKEKKNDI